MVLCLVQNQPAPLHVHRASQCKAAPVVDLRSGSSGIRSRSSRAGLRSSRTGPRNSRTRPWESQSSRSSDIPDGPELRDSRGPVRSSGARSGNSGARSGSSWRRVQEHNQYPNPHDHLVPSIEESSGGGWGWGVRLCTGSGRFSDSLGA